jgi:hypothetical protein
MKNRIFLFLICLFASQIKVFSQCGGGELYFTIKPQPTAYRIDVKITTSEYSWYWDSDNYKPLPNATFQDSFAGVICKSYLAPKNGSVGSIPWGIFSINIKGRNQYGSVIIERTFTLDLRDEYWSSYGSIYPGVDTFIEFNTSNPPSITISARQNGINKSYVVNDGSSFDIWGLWGIAVNPLQSNFKIPVFTYNRVEGQTFDFGYLRLNEENINSGKSRELLPRDINNIKHGSVDTIFNYQRKYSYKCEKSGNISSPQNQNFFNDELNFSIASDPEMKSVTRNFRPVYPLTIKNSLDELGGISTDIVYFKDPTTTNSYEQKSASGSGFYKDNAFDSLSIIVGNNPEQKYGAKAVSLINYNGYSFQYSGGDFSTTGTDFIISSPATKTAHYKGIQLSSQTNAIAGSGQRKFVKTSDGYLHQVYESLNKIWYERSTDNGITWEVMNGGAPVSVGNAKQPSIDFYNTATDKVVVIVYEAYSSSTVNLMAAIYKDGVSQTSYGLFLYTGMIQEDVDALNCSPVVSISSDGKILIVWYADGELAPGALTGLNYKYGYLYNYYGTRWMINWYTPLPVLMSSTNYFTLKNPTLSVYKPAVQPFQLAYERDNAIYYRTLTDNVNHQNHIQEGTVQNISSGSGFSFNKNPSILAWNGGARVVWEGNNDGYKKKIIFRSPSYSYFWSFNNNGGAYNCKNPNINRPDNYSTYYFSWSENNQGYMDNNTLSPTNIKYLGISGQDIQLCNGATPGAMYATTLKTSSTPYYFTQSASLGSFYGLSKSSEIFAGSEGRRGVVYKNSAEFYFNFGKITVDDNNIGYVQIDESKDSLDVKTLNHYLVSQPFNLIDNSSFSFNIQYAVTDIVNANAVLADNDYVSFKLQLVDYATSVILGEYDNVKFTKSNLSDHNNLDYLVNTKGIGSKTVILKLAAESNFEARYALTLENSGEANNNLNKQNFKEVSYNEGIAITKYELEQNYPNPFNPSTTIRYQLPKDGLVTLKIYDILGSEIATLVNEEKIAGKYEINFNASSLASGVYIYRIAIHSDKIQAADFTSSKKMLMIK